MDRCFRFKVFQNDSVNCLYDQRVTSLIIEVFINRKEKRYIVCKKELWKMRAITRESLEREINEIELEIEKYKDKIAQALVFLQWKRWMQKFWALKKKPLPE